MTFNEAFKALITATDQNKQKEALSVLNATILEKKTISLSKNVVKSVTKLPNTNDEYVYDIGMRNAVHPWFFGNNILVHNSVYFSAYPTLKDDIANGSIEWTRDSIVSLYDTISEDVNSTFPQFMKDAFNCPLDRGQVIKAGREIVADSGLFITKKRYAVRYYDKDGKRYDTGGKIGKMKAMGLDLKRADTPDYMQEFLTEVLNSVLDARAENEILDRISEFRKEFREMEPWKKGSPKRANAITSYAERAANDPKLTVPGHVRASLNWNTLKSIYQDRYSMSIVDGAKVIVCRLKQNPFGFSSVAYPVDEPHLPQWFKDLPFDHDKMEEIVIDKKIENLLGVLNYDLASTKQANLFNSFFTFE